jgi:hypothetical protein
MLRVNPLYLLKILFIKWLEGIIVDLEMLESFINLVN